jgi:hypothetical protein
MKKGFENGRVVPIAAGNKQSGWPQMPDADRQRACRVYPILNVGAMNMKSYGEWLYQDKKERAAKVFGSLAAQLRAKRDGV